MKIFMVLCAIFIVFLQTFGSGTMSQEMLNVLVPSPSSPISTSSGVVGALHCTQNSDESYAVCASWSNAAIKYNLHPFSFAAKGPNQGNYMISCDLYEATSQTTSRAVCVKNGSPNGIVYFHRVSDMINITNVTLGAMSNYPHAIVDTPNQVAYIANYNYPPAIHKIKNIGSSTPIFAESMTSFGSGDYTPSAMLIIDGFLYVHWVLNPAHLARINISTFTWNQTVIFASGEYNGNYDNLANDDNFIYDLTTNGILVRCTYKNNNFARFDSLRTGYAGTRSLAISPDFTFLLLIASYSGILVVNASTFSVESRALLRHPISSGYVSAVGRPIILSKNNNTNTYPICAFSQDNDYVYTFNFSRVPFREVYPSIYPLSSSPINTSSGVVASLQCTKNSDESYAVCASFNSLAIKYNLQPFSFAAKGPVQGNYMYSCDLYEASSQSTSRAVCAKGSTGKASVVYFLRISDMINVTNVTTGSGAGSLRVIVDAPNQVAYASNFNTPPAIYKIINIGSATPIFAATLSLFGSGDEYPTSMLIIGGFLFVHFFIFNNPARLARINISTFTWNQTVTFATGERDGQYDNLANDDKFIYDLTENGVLVRCTYKNNIFARFDSLISGIRSTWSLGISPDQRTLFIATNDYSVVQMICVSPFAVFGNAATVPSAFGRPIITKSYTMYAMSQTSDSVYTFRINSSACGPTLSAELSASPTSSSTSLSISVSLRVTSSPSITQQTATSDATLTASRDERSITGDTPSASASSDLTPSAPNISLSSSSSPSQIESFSLSSSQSASAIVPPPPYISPLRKVYEIISTTSSLLSVATMSSTNVIAAVRARSALKHMSNILGGTCELDEETMRDLEDNSDEASSSPTQLKISNYLVGQVIGNMIVIFGVGALWIGGNVVIHGHGKDEKENKKKNFVKKEKKAFEALVVDSIAHEMMLFFALLLLEPTLSASATLLISGFVVAGRNVTIFAIVCFVLGWFVLLCGLALIVRSWVLSRDVSRDVFELLDDEAENRNKSMFRRFIEYTTSPFGEWNYTGDKPRKRIQFELARPFIESFTERFPKFIIVDIGVIVALSLAEILPQMFSSGEVACFVGGVIVCFVLSLHVLLVVFYRPLYTDRLSNSVGCLVDVLSIVAVAGAMNSGDQDDADQIETWSRLAVAQSVIQMVMTVLQVTEVLFPLWDGGMELMTKHLFSSESSNKTDVCQKSRNSNNNRNGLTRIMNQEEHDDSFSSPLLQEMAVISLPENTQKSTFVVNRLKIIRKKLPLRKRESQVAESK